MVILDSEELFVLLRPRILILFYRLLGIGSVM